MTRPPEDEPLLLSPPLPPPHAVSAIAPAMPVAISAAWRLLNFTCDASHVPRCAGGTDSSDGAGLGQPDARFHGKGDPSTLQPAPNVGATLGTPPEDRPRPTPSCDLLSRPSREAQLSLVSRQSAGPLAAAVPPVRRPSGRPGGVRVCQRRLPGYGRG